MFRCFFASYDCAIPMARAGVPKDITRAFPQLSSRYLSALLTFAIFVKVFALETLAETGLNLVASGAL